MFIVKQKNNKISILNFWKSIKPNQNYKQKK